MSISICNPRVGWILMLSSVDSKDKDIGKFENLALRELGSLTPILNCDPMA